MAQPRAWLRSWGRYGYLLALVPVLAGLYGLVWSVTGGRSAMGREWDFTLQCAAAALGGLLLLCLCRKVEGPEP